MKLQIKKIVSLFACICVALSVMAVAPFAADTQVVFDFGAKGATGHVDGSQTFTSKSWTEGEYTLTLTNASKVYAGGKDAQGNATLKLGTSSVVGSFKMTAPADVTAVIFNVAQYKSNTTKINVNGAAHTITTASNNGAYTAITVDTTATKDITFATVSGGVRCMIDSIVYVIADTTTGGGNEGEGGNVGGGEGEGGNVGGGEGEGGNVGGGEGEGGSGSVATQATISFAEDANRTSYSTTQQVWEQNGIKVTNDKSSSTTNIRDNLGDNHIRCYQGSKVTIEYPGMTKIVINALSNYVSGWSASINDSNATAATSGTDVTITFATPVDSIVFNSLTAQSRATAITVYTGDAGSGEEQEPETKTIAEVLAMTDGPTKFYLTGEIVETYGTNWATYGNFKLKDSSTTDTIILYGLNDQNGVRYDEMTTKPVVGDTIKVLANRSSYNGVGQLANAILVDHTPGTPSGGGEGGESTTPSTPAEIVDAAYNLAAGAKITGVTLTGKVTEIVEEFSSQYGNITVKFVIEGKEDKPLNCKRMVVTDATTVEVGDTITVEGDIENNTYQGTTTFQFYKPTLKNVVKASGGNQGGGNEGGSEGGNTLPTPDATNTLTIPQAITLAEAQEAGQYAADKYYVTGKITAIANTQYGNMYIADDQGNEIYVYGVYSADGETLFEALNPQPKVGDTITIYCQVGKYNTTIQLKSGWLQKLVEGEGEGGNSDPAADSVLTVKQAIDLALSKKHDIYTANKYYVTGTITEIYNEQYGNMKITDADGNILTLYGTYDEEGNRFDAMTDKPAVGDEITIYGIIGQYNGTAQVKNGVFKAAPAGGNQGGNQGGNAGDNNQGGNTGDNNQGSGSINNGGANSGNTGSNGSDKAPVTADNMGFIACLIALVLSGAALVVTKKFARN